jgi:hypothetical protein
LQLDKIITALQSKEYANREHGEIEQYIKNEGNEVLRCLFQGYLDQKADNELPQPFVTSNTGEILNHVKEKTILEARSYV